MWDPKLRVKSDFFDSQFFDECFRTGYIKPNGSVPSAGYIILLGVDKK